MSLPFKEVTATQIGLVWDKGSIGVMTRKNNPTVESLFGEILVRPGNFFGIEKFTDEKSLAGVCEGSDLVMFAHANSTGTAITYEWSDSIPGVNGRTSLGKQTGPVARRLHPLWGCDYEICGKGDTLKIYNASAKIDSAIFRCVAQDLTVPGSYVDHTRSVEMKVSLRDRFQAFLTDAQPTKYFTKADTIYRCPGEKAQIRFMIGGMESLNEYKAESGTVSVRYIYIPAVGGGAIVDTIHFNVDMMAMEGSTKKIYAFNKAVFASVEKDGCYYVDQVWSSFCDNATPYPAFDTVFVKERNFEQHYLDPVSVTINQSVDVTPDLTWTNASNKNSVLGSVFDNGAGKVEYIASAQAGTDTVLFSRSQNGCTMNAERQVNIISEKYLSLNVMLEGPYLAKGDSMMCVYIGYFPPEASTTEYESPYPDKMKINRPFPKYDKGISDWIYVELWDYPPFGIGSGDSRRGVLIDSISGLLLSDGTVCSATKAEKFLTFQKLTGDDYYVIVRHRGHLAIMSKEKITLSSTKPVVGAFPMIDFSGKTGKPLSAVDEAFDNEGGFSFPPLINVNGRNLMYLGDIRNPNQSFSVDAVDFKTLKEMLSSGGYLDGDFDFNGTINAVDMSACKRNIGKYVKY